MRLRPYQQQAVCSAFKEWERVRSTLVVLPVGTGKTLVAAETAKRVVALGGRFCFIAHTDELMQQGANEIEQYTGIPVAIEKALSTAHDSITPITVASLQSIGQARRMNRFSPNHYDVVCGDESHRAAGPTYRRLFSYFKGAKCMGITATPSRSDKLALSTVFDSIAYEYRLKDAIKDGYLVPIVAQQIPVAVNLDGLKMRRGEYDADEMDELIRPYLESLANMVVSRGEGRPGISFLPLVSTSQLFADMLRDRGIKAEAVWGTDPKRTEKIKGIKSGEIDHLCNSNLLTEGFNAPRVSLICPFIPTRSRGRYIQQIGRGTRTCDGKQDLLILDPLWLASKHVVCTPASLFGETQEVNDIATEARRMKGGRGNVLEDVEQAYSDFAKKREAKIARELDLNRYRKARAINPLDFATLVHDNELLTYSPTHYWEEAQATDKQKEYLSKAGFDSAGMTKGMAYALFNRINKRREEGLATPKQVKTMAQVGIKNAEKYSFGEAKKIIGIASGCGFVTTYTMNKLRKSGLLKENE